MVLYSVGAPERVIPKPTGEKSAKGSISTTDSYQTVCELTVTRDKTFHPCKLTVSCDQDVMVKIRFDGEDISIEYYVTAGLPFTDWYPWDWNPCVGDGTKKVDVQAKYPTGGSAGTCYAEICGEEV